MAKNQLVKSRRLRCSEHFKQAFRQGSKVRQGCLTVYIRSNGLEYARLGLAITRKSIPKATSRNWIKRIIRESFRLNQSLVPGFDIIIAVKGQCLTNKQILSCDLAKQWSRLLVYYKKA
ncbi:MAG: ribonuclease P protein component [Rickettsiella sp.]|nr:ribonuclease P protein component [Rickettsiella sp.]